MTELIDKSKWIFDRAKWVGSSIEVEWKASNPISNIVHGKSYSLKFRARNTSGTGSCRIFLQFRTDKEEQFRIYEKVLVGTSPQDVTIDFVGPTYTKKVSLVIQPSGTRTIVESISIADRSTPIIQTEPLQNFGAPSYVPAGYKLVFNDEFQGTSLNRKKWFTRYIYEAGQLDHLGDGPGGEKQRYRDNGNHVLANGWLHLVCKKVNNNADGVRYESGMIRSDAVFRYGYFECKAKMPKGKGVFGAFWLNADVSGEGRFEWPPEIDIWEFVNNGLEDKPDMLHSGVVNHHQYSSHELVAAVQSNTLDGSYWNDQYTFWKAPFDFTDDWHVFGLEWIERYEFTASNGQRTIGPVVKMTVDGKTIYIRRCPWVYTDGSPGPKAHVLLNLAAGGSWAGRHGIDEASMPWNLQVSYVRVYQKTP